MQAGEASALVAELEGILEGEKQGMGGVNLEVLRLERDTLRKERDMLRSRIAGLEEMIGKELP